MRLGSGRVRGRVSFVARGLRNHIHGPDNPFKKITDALSPPPLDKPLDRDITGSVDAPSEFTRKPFEPPGTPPPLKPELLGSDPNDDLSVGKKYYRQGSYGLAERHFRRAVELTPRDAEAWVGLAAAYDRLHRFDLADRAYAQAIKLIGETPEIMNNQGFSYILRSDYRRARAILLAAQAKAPDNPHIAANLQMLGKAERKAKGIN